MTLSLLQLNINADNYWDALSAYLTSNSFDIIFLQEVCGKGTTLGNIDCQRDCFAELHELLSEKYNGALAIAERFTSSPSSYMGNAIFYRKEFSLQKEQRCIMYERATPFPTSSSTFEDEGRVLLDLMLTKEGKTISFLTTHFAWAKTPHEQPHQTKQGAILIDYLANLSHPFVFAGDLNLDQRQPTIQKIENLARNLTKEYSIATTINPRTHRVPGLSVAVDYIFVTNDITVKEYSVITEDLSDHLGVKALIEV